METTVLQDETPDIVTSSDDYARRFEGSVGRWFLRVQADITLQMLAPYPGTTILEVGGGHGQITRPLLEQGFDVTVFGSDESCRTQIEDLIENKRCSFETGSLLRLPYPDRSFGVVIAYRLMAHINQWERLLTELTRVADKAVIIDYPETRSINFLTPMLFKVKKGLEGNTRTYTCYRRQDLRQAFKRHHFIVADHFNEFFLPMVVHRKLGIKLASQMMERIARLLGLTGQFGSPVIMKLIREQIYVPEQTAQARLHLAADN